MKPARVNALVAGYQAGRTMKELAAEFGINRRTVPVHLRRAGVPIRRDGLGHDQIAEAVSLYEAGWSSGRLAETFDVSANSVLESLRQAGVSIRPRRGGPASRRASG